MDPDEIDAIVGRLENRLRAAWKQAIRDMKDETKLADIRDAIAANNIGAIVEGMDEAIADFGHELAAGYVYAGQKAARDIEDLTGETFRFDLADEASVSWMTDVADRIAGGLMQQQEATARRVIEHGLARGDSPLEIASAVQDSIGLGPAQVDQVERYRTLLENGDYIRAQTYELADGRFDATLDRLADTGGMLGEDTIDRMVDRYRDNWQRTRADGIALEEAQNASNAGVEASFAQAIDRDLFSDDDYEREWVSMGDMKVRTSHKRLDGYTVTGDDLFPGLYGDLRYPGDEDAPDIETIGCRCRLARRINGVGDTVNRTGGLHPTITDHRGETT